MAVSHERGTPVEGGGAGIGREGERGRGGVGLRVCVGREGRWEQAGWTSQVKSFNLKLSGDGVYCTNALPLLIRIMLCGELHCHIFSRLTLFSFRMEGKKATAD